MKRHCLLIAGGLAAITLASSLRTLAIESIVPQDLWLERLRPISTFLDKPALPPRQLEVLRDWISDSSLHFVDYAICKNDSRGSGNCAEPLRTATKIGPADGRLWLERAMAVASQGGSNTEAIESLLVSYKIAPREGWIAKSRLRFALQVWPALPEAVRTLTVGDLLKPWEEALNSLPHAVEFLHFAGEQGNVHALERLGHIYLNGEGVSADAQRAQKFFEQAIALGSVSAQIRLGIGLVKGNNLPRNAAKGQELLQAAAKKDSWGKVALANFLLSGELPRDPGGALALLQSAADSGDYYALERLGQTYLHGQGVPANPKKGRAYLERAIAAGSAGAQIELGAALVKGQKLERNIELGQHLLEAAAIKDSWGKLALANLLMSGDLSRNVGRAIRLFQAAGEDGNHYALERLGRIFLHGEGVTADPERGREYLQRAIVAGNIGAQAELGVALVTGVKLRKDVIAGQRLLESAAAKDTWGKLALANLLLSGELPRDVGRALDLLHTAAQAGNSHAWQRLGQVYLNGEGVTVDEQKGREYLARASAQGIPVQD